MRLLRGEILEFTCCAVVLGNLDLFNPQLWVIAVQNMTK
jgi:hypothetical protein